MFQNYYSLCETAFGADCALAKAAQEWMQHIMNPQVRFLIRLSRNPNFLTMVLYKFEICAQKHIVSCKNEAHAENINQLSRLCINMGRNRGW